MTVPAAFGVQRDYLWSEQSRFRAFVRRTQETYDLALFVNADRLANDRILGELDERARASGVWLLDDFDTIPRSGLDFASFDHRATFNPIEARSLSDARGIRFDYVPQGFAPIAPAPMPSSGRPLVLGAPYPSRREAVHALVGAGIAVDVVGKLWPQWVTPSAQIGHEGDVSLERSVSMSGAARICVNGHRSPETGVSPRVFEIGGAGGVVATDGMHAPEFFEPDTEMIHWSHPDELVEPVMRLLREPALAAAMAERSQRRTLSEHTMKHRFSQLLASWGYA
ncbi:MULTISPECIES: glycosyltransferase family protein [unclassified Agromyces]|uniref:glycosyltransferase family protein n=1 Tax=unclassified Agromyces TaxID=2639701 RepID=UPI00301420AB